MVLGNMFPESDSEDAINSLNLLQLPPVQLKVMRIMLRYKSLNMRQVVEQVVAYTTQEEETPAEPVVVDSLNALVEGGWLSCEGQMFVYKPGTIQRSFHLNKEHSAPAEPDEAPANERHRGGKGRINSFWDKLSEDSPKPPSDEKPLRARRDEAQSAGYVSSLFKELTGGTAKTLEDIPEEKRQSQPMQPSGGGHISKLFEELRAKPDDPKNKK
jgi:hypothetical protein